MRERKEHLDALAVSLLLASCLFWGFQQILIKTTVAEVPPLWQAAIRFIGATVLLGVWCVARGVKLFERDGTLRAGLLAGALFAGEFTCIYLGLRDTAASRLTVFLYTSPFVVALLLPRIVPSEKLRPAQWLGLTIAFAAVALAFSEGFSGHSTPRQLRGDALALGAGILWGLTTLVIRGSKLASASAEKTLFYQVAVTALVAPFISLGFGETWSLQYSSIAWLSLALGENWSLSYSGAAWVSIALQTVIGAFASYLAWMWMLRHYPATQLSSFTFLAPLFALLFGVVLAFSESFGHSTSAQLRGDALALAAGVLWGLTTIVIRGSKLATASAEKTLFYQVAVTAAVAPFLSIGLGEPWSLQYSAYAWTSIALQTAIGAFASYLAWMWMLRHYPATQLSSFTFLAPLFALLFGVALLDEKLTPQLLIALVAVAAGIVLVNRKR